MPGTHRESPTPGPAAPDVVARLESLDDVIFPAIEGDPQALAHAEPAWREAVDALGPDIVQESRSEYLRYARATWDRLRNSAAAQPSRVLAVLQIIALLSGLDV